MERAFSFGIPVASARGAAENPPALEHQRQEVAKERPFFPRGAGIIRCGGLSIAGFVKQREENRLGALHGGLSRIGLWIRAIFHRLFPAADQIPLEGEIGCLVSMNIGPCEGSVLAAEEIGFDPLPWFEHSTAHDRFPTQGLKLRFHAFGVYEGRSGSKLSLCDP